MIYRIVHENPGRLRVRCGQWVITEEEAPSVVRYLEEVDGVTHARVTAANGGILVEYERGHRKDAIEALDALSVKDLPELAAEVEPNMDILTNRFQVKLTWAIGWRVAKRLLPPPIYAAVTIAGAIPFIYNGIKALTARRITVDVLDATAIGTALLTRDFKTAGSIMFLLTVSDLLAEYTQSRTRCALRQNMSFYAESVWVVDGDNEYQVPLEEVEVGDIIRVRTGQLIPIDGTIVGGSASINESSMTGEAALVAKLEGDSVFAGTAVDEGEISIQTTSIAGQSRIDSIVDMVENSEDAKAALQSKAEKLADGLVPVSLGIFGANLLATRNLTAASNVLMVDYSCAIKLCTPIAVMTAMREATRLGIVAKGGKYLEQLAGADTIVFDKTGTLTSAEPVCTHVITFGSMSENAALRLAACLEEHFPHSMARAVVRGAEQRGLYEDYELHTDVEYIVAHGIASNVNGMEARIGSAHFIFEDEGVPIPDGLDERIAAEAADASVIYLSLDGRLEAALCITDRLRDEAVDAIAGLRERGFTNIVMLTGDSENCARSVAQQLGLDEYHAQVLPEDKASYVERLKEEGRTVVMVGDGINDSPALACADVSIAMSDASDIARTVADITILEPTLDKLLVARDLSQALIKRIGQTYGVIAGFNTGLIALGLMRILAPATTALLHNASTAALAALNMRPLLEASDETA